MKEILECFGYAFVYRQGEYTIYKDGVKIPNVSYRTRDQAENYCCRLIVHSCMSSPGVNRTKARAMLYGP